MKSNSNKALRLRLKSVAMIFAMTLASVAAGVLTSCSSDVKEEIEQLFAVVPSNSSVVVTLNVEQAVKESGGKIADGKVEDFGSLTGVMDSADAPAAVVKTLQDVGRVTSGPMAGFVYKNQMYFVTSVDDADAFKSAYAAEQADKESWTEADGASVRGNVAVVKDRVWVLPSASAVSDAVGFMTLSEAESFNSNAYAATMAKSGHSLNVYGDINALLGSGLSFGQQTQARMAMSMVFNQPKYLEAWCDFKGNSAAMTLRLLDDDLKAAKCELDLSKIDPKVVAGLGGNAETIVAIGVSQKLVEQISKFAGSFGGGLPIDVSSIISPLQGTQAFATGSSLGSTGDNNFRAVVSTNGKDNAQLGQLLATLGTVKIDGTTFNISKGRYGEGSLNVSDVAQEMKDAWLGMAMAKKSGASDEKILVLLEPADGTLQLRLHVENK
ncbi:MAG: hypothetical protein K2L83_01525 [Muribaculaceae bacterium]|nr:hypothetical protein [Muribaculaceae bacterium]